MTHNTQHNTHTRSRNWCFTLNNYDDEDLKLFQEIPKSKFTFQQETGENGTPHLQGLLMFDNARTLKSMKKIHPRAHWEVCRNIKASQLYCSKKETRTGETFSNMDPPTLKRQPMTREEMRNEAIKKMMEIDEPEMDEILEQIMNFKVMKPACLYRDETPKRPGSPDDREEVNNFVDYEDDYDDDLTGLGAGEDAPSSPSPNSFYK